MIRKYFSELDGLVALLRGFCRRYFVQEIHVFSECVHFCSVERQDISVLQSHLFRSGIDYGFNTRSHTMTFDDSEVFFRLGVGSSRFGR
jgi:hypothetical protein